MLFYVEKIILWLKNGYVRTLDFENDKVNVITGNSKTGKTAIKEIFDYCFCGSESVISEARIGNNVQWYGIKFHINNKTYTIARGEYKDSYHLSSDYYFSSTGEIPELPNAMINEKELKQIIETEFSINSDVSFLYGGKKIKQGSKISFRYFLLFNVLSGDVIAHSKEYFDKMNDEKYSEALHRIFDLALNITSIKNILIHQRIEEAENEKKRLEKRAKDVELSIKEREHKIRLIIKQAKENQIISSTISDDEECIRLINEYVTSGLFQDSVSEESEKLRKLEKTKQELEIKIRRLTRFKKSLKEYRERLKNEADALSPVQYLLDDFTSHLSDSEYLMFLQGLSHELESIKKEIKTKYPFEVEVDTTIKGLREKLDEIQKEISETPVIIDEVVPENLKYIALGEIKYKLSLILEQNIDSEGIKSDIDKKDGEISDLRNEYVDPTEKRNTTVDALNEYIQIYLDEAQSALDEYANYKSDFDYKTKTLRLRKLRVVAPASITSSSDHMFMHLCMFLGMHNFILNSGSEYIIPFLIADQPSRPYFNNKSSEDYRDTTDYLKDKDDWSKVQSIFKLFESFIENILREGKHFQIIVLEHVSEDAWEGCKYVHLVDVFDGTNNALIPPQEIRKE